MITGYFEAPSGEAFINTHDRGLIALDQSKIHNIFHMPEKMRSNYRMPLWNYMFEIHNGRFFKMYKVGTGKTYKVPPPQVYTVRSRKKNPVYYDSKDRQYYQPGDPNNEYGTRWIQLDASGQFGIHGTTHADPNDTDGCIAMSNSDIEEVFDIVRRGTKVKVEGEKPLRRGRK